MSHPLISSVKLYECLKNKGVKNFYHANTVVTSLNFISENALLSRKYVEDNNLPQTHQYTDELDKKVNIWDDVFLDGTDLHRKFSRRNLYGPVLFHIALEILLIEGIKVKVTRNNPSNWGSTAQGKFYDSIDDIADDYLTGDNYRDGGIMFVFDRPDKLINLNAYCSKIVIDNPLISLISSDSIQKPISDYTTNTLTTQLIKAGITNIPIELRHNTSSSCACWREYKNLVNKNKKEFDRYFKKSI